VEELKKAYYYRPVSGHYVFVVPTFEEEGGDLFVEIVVCGRADGEPYFNSVHLGLSEARFIADAVRELEKRWKSRAESG